MLRVVLNPSEGERVRLMYKTNVELLQLKRISIFKGLRSKVHAVLKKDDKNKFHLLFHLHSMLILMCRCIIPQ